MLYEETQKSRGVMSFAQCYIPGCAKARILEFAQ